MSNGSPIGKALDEVLSDTSAVHNFLTEERAEVLLRVADAAKAWWQAKLHNDENHLLHPTMHCNNKVEKDLALAVFEWIKIGG